VLLGVAGGVLFASLFMPWYGVNRSDFLVIFGAVGRLDLDGSAWRVFSIADVALAAVAVYIVGLAVVTARGLLTSILVKSVLSLPVVAALVFVVVRIFDRPDLTALYPPHLSGLRPMHLTYGAVVALAALMLAALVLVVASIRRPESA
jgi:hypothetical protein